MRIRGRLKRSGRAWRGLDRVRLAGLVRNLVGCAHCVDGWSVVPMWMSSCGFGEAVVSTCLAK